jgi:GT2 family glycosyltransferase
LTQTVSHRRHIVTAVLVVHDGARFLPGLIQAVREQTQPVHRAVGVDTSSRDRSGAMLAELLGPGAVFGMEADTGYGTAISRALQHPAARAPVPAQGTDQEAAVEWIWLLHDDCEPAPDALEQLLRAASRGKTTAVLGPKLRDLADRRVLREAGITVDRAGRRITGIEPGEIDQGQHDGNRAVVAVSSAGMLVRRDVWDQLGGFDANLPLCRDDIDFCWRAHAAGYDVRVVTDAVMYHRELSARQIRKAPAAGGRPRMLDRRGALYVFAVNVPFGPMLVMMGGCVAGTLLRAAYFLITKQQRKAFDQLGALAWLARHPIRLWRARRRRAATLRHGYGVLRDQLPKGRALAKLAESVASLLSRGPAYEGGGMHSAITDGLEDELLLPNENSVVRRVFTNPGVLLFAGLLVVALVAERSLVGPVLSGSGTLSGGALAPAWGGASDLWREYLAGYHATGVGSAASAPPYLAVVAALATLLAGKTWLAIDVLLLGCVPAAGVTAFLAARRVTAAVPARLWIAGTYALLPVAMGAVAAGRIGMAVAFVLLPPIGIALGRVITGPSATVPSRFTTRRAAWAAALLIAVAAAFVPLIWAIAVVAALAALAAWRWLPPATASSAVIVAVVPGVVLVPWTFELFARPSAFLLEAGLAGPGMAAAGIRPASLLLLSPGGPGLPPVWVTAGLVLPAFCALLLRRRTALVYSGWGIALAGLVVALVVSRMRVTPPQGGPAVSAWPGVAIAIAAAGLLLAAVPVIEAVWRAVGRGERPSDGRPRWRTLTLIAGLAATASAPLLAAGWWLATGVPGPLTTAAPQILPAFVAATSAGPDRPRTLVLRQDGGILAYTVLRTSDPVLGEPELAQAVTATRALDTAVASLAAASGGDGGDPSQALSQFDIGYVLLPAPIDQTLAHQLDGAAGLVSLTQAPAYDLWQVAGPVARVRIVMPNGTVVPVPSGTIGAGAIIPAGMSGTLLLAEASGGWSATLNGRSLASLAGPVDGWAQGFTLPASGGRLVITRNETARDVTLGAEAAAVLVTFALALPGTRSVAPATSGTVAADADAKPAASRRRRESAGRKRSRRPELARMPLRARGRGADSARDSGVLDHTATDPIPAARLDLASDGRSDGRSDIAASLLPDPAQTARLDPASAARPDLAPDGYSDIAASLRPDPAQTVPPDMAPTPRPDLAPISRPDLAPISRPDLAPTGRPDLAPISSPDLAPIGRWDPAQTAPPDVAPTARPDVAPTGRPDVAPTVRPDPAPSARPDVARRPRGGAHAARHGKPSRRWRPGGADRAPDRAPDRPLDRPPVSVPEAAKSSAMAGPEPGQASQYSPTVTQDFAAGDGADYDGADYEDALPQESGQVGSRPPWELGNGS